jgi:hypothetical protein
MGDMPNDVYIFPDPKSIGDRGFTLDLPESTLDGEPYTHYVRADIHEAELTKLRNALDVAERALGSLCALNNNPPSPFAGEIGKDRVDRAWQGAQEALTAIKQARGES